MGPLPNIEWEEVPKSNKVVKKRRKSREEHYTTFDGRWVLIECTGIVSMWLHSLHIQGERVILGDGAVARLRKDDQGNTVLEGGVLFLQNTTLVRAGKSGSIVKYSHVRSKEAPMGDMDDRRTLISSACSSDDVANMRDLDSVECPSATASNHHTGLAAPSSSSSEWMPSGDLGGPLHELATEPHDVIDARSLHDVNGCLPGQPPAVVDTAHVG